MQMKALADTPALSDWLARSGAEVSAIAVAHDDRRGRMIRATADIPAGETVLRIPHTALLTRHVARRSAVGRQILEADIDAPGGHSFLAAYLLLEKRNPASHLAPYLRALPSTFPTVPLFFHRELLPVLQGSFAGALMMRRKEMLLHDFVLLRREVPALRDMSLREFFWARTVVITRVFGVKIHGKSTEALVPLADMMNHRRPPDVEWAYDDGDGAFSMTASRDIRAGEEICDSYGRKPNGRFFVHYGFALESGADDEVELRLALSPGDDRHAARAAALRNLGGPETEHRVATKLRSDETLRCFSYLRTASAAEGELAKAARQLEAGQPVGPLSPRSEAAALALLDRACAEALGRFETPDERDDEAQLARADLSVNLRNALLVRRGEKRLLASLRRLASEATPLLRLPRRQFFEAALHYTGEPFVMSYLLDAALALAPREARPPSFRSVGL